MPPTPFEHGLALAWSDGALSRDGAAMLETLQLQLGMSDAQRAVQEEAWLKEISRTDRRSFGDGDSILKEWLEALNDREALEPAARSMGKAALKLGLSKATWREAESFAKGLGLNQALAEGAWLEEEADELSDWPPALDPLAIILGLVVGITGVSKTNEIEFSNCGTFVKIDYPNATSTHLSWMPDLLPIEGEKSAWGWKDADEPTIPLPIGDLVFCNSILLSWIRRLIAMRRTRGEAGLHNLPPGIQLMPSSSELKTEDDKITISMIVDLGDAGLVRPWASVLLSNGAPSIIPAPEGLAQNWISIHDAMAGILIQGLETLPRQLLIASGLTMGYTNIRQQENWLVHDLVKL